MKQTLSKIQVFLIITLIAVIMEGCCCPRKYIPDIHPKPVPGFYVPEKIRVALVLGSGGVRGMAHVGVIEELESAGIAIDLIVGCSAGSIVGALYAANPSAEDIKCTVSKLKSNSIFDIDLWNCRFGLSQGRSLRRVLNRDLCSETFEELQIPLILVASDLNTGELVVMGSGDLVKAICASCSIPFVFVPCEHMGRVLVDGSVINPVPVVVAKDLGADLIIAVDLCELLPKTFPTNLFGVASRSAEIGFMWQNEVCTHKADVIIRPKTCGIGTFDDTMKSQIYEAGKLAAREQLPRIKALLANIPEKDCSSGRRFIELGCYSPEICKEEEKEEKEET